MPAVSETGMRFHEVLDQLGLELQPVSAGQVRIAEVAYSSFGKGMHSAGLNFADCFAYALAKETGESILFKGDDFSNTDLRSALAD